MNTKSAKAKGRRLQQHVRNAVLQRFPHLDPDDVRSTPMGSSGDDLLLSPLARAAFPFAVECKNQEALNIWDALAQAEARRTVSRTPLVVFTRNRAPVYVALSLNDLLTLLRDTE